MGQPFLVLDGVLMSRNSGVANYDVSASGDLVYIPGIVDKGERTLVWVDRQGNPEALKLPPRPYLHPRISPDTRQFAIVGDQGIHEKCGDDFWREVTSGMSDLLKQGRFTDAILDTIQRVGDVLARNFPRDSDDQNELPDQIVRD